jgi:hypothetical protein
MSIGPLGGIVAGAAGSPLAQTKGSEVERAAQQLGAERRHVYHERKAEAAAGVGEPDGEDHEAAERDADGRPAWEEPPEPTKGVARRGAPPSKDPLQQSGNLLDLSG